MLLQNSKIFSVEQNKDMVSFRSIGVYTKNIRFRKLDKFYFLTFMSVARYSGYDHFQEISTVALTRISFEESHRTHARYHLPRTLPPQNVSVAPENSSFAKAFAHSPPQKTLNTC